MLLITVDSLLILELFIYPQQLFYIGFIDMGKKRVLVSYGVDIDAVAGWLGSYGGEDSTSDISRGKDQRLNTIVL